MENPENKLNVQNQNIETPEQPISKDDEKILVFGKQIMEDIGMLEIFKTSKVLTVDIHDTAEYTSMTNTLNKLWDKSGHINRRGDMEHNENYLQPIPAVLIKRGNKLFTYKRLEGSGEERLHNKVSVTVGGHMNMIMNEYYNFEHLLALNAARELEEEVFILDDKGNEINNHYQQTKHSKIIGIGYTDETSVDRVHLAVYSIIEIPEDYDVKVKETEVLDGEFKTLDEIKQYDLENWTKMILDVIEF